MITLPRAVAARAGASDGPGGAGRAVARPLRFLLLLAVLTTTGCLNRGQPDLTGRLPDPEAEPADTVQPHPNVVRGRDVRGEPVMQIEEWIAARVPGVQLVRGPDGGLSLRIRGATSFYGNNEPLYVVDGMPVRTVPGQGLDWLNPRDVATIEVLKDASSLSQYGVRGANGVILITTRRAGPPR